MSRPSTTDLLNLQPPNPEPCSSCGSSELDDHELRVEQEDAYGREREVYVCVFTCEQCGEKYPLEEKNGSKRDGYFCEECWSELESEDRSDYWEDDDSPYLADGTMFADPGGNSALRAATEDNPRNLPCPSCDAPNRLTPADRALGYQCDQCADQAERGY